MSMRRHFGLEIAAKMTSNRARHQSGSMKSQKKKAYPHKNSSAVSSAIKQFI